MTRLMVLGLLSNKPMTGYDIQQGLQMVQADKWAGILSGSIYHALKKLEQEGMIELDTVEKTGNRSKAAYKLTEAGHKELLRLLKESLKQSSVEYPTTLYTALSFIELLPVSTALEAFDNQKLLLEEEYRVMKAGQAAKESVYELPELVKVVFKNIYRQIELQLDFLSELRELLIKKA